MQPGELRLHLRHRLYRRLSSLIVDWHRSESHTSLVPMQSGPKSFGAECAVITPDMVVMCCSLLSRADEGLHLPVAYFLGWREVQDCNHAVGERKLGVPLRSPLGHQVTMSNLQLTSRRRKQRRRGHGLEQAEQ